MRKEIKVKVILTDGYERRFTQACLEELEKKRYLDTMSTGLSTKEEPCQRKDA